MTERLNKRRFARMVAAANPGVTVRWRPSTAEWRVNVERGTEATAYYTSDADDCAATARAMWQAHYTGTIQQEAR